MKAGLDIDKSLGINESKELVDLLFKMVAVFKFRHMLTDELGT